MSKPLVTWLQRHSSLSLPALCNPTHKVLIRYLQSRSLSPCPLFTMTTSKGRALGSWSSDGWWDRGVKRRGLSPWTFRGVEAGHRGQGLGRSIVEGWRRKWQPIPGFLPGASHGRRSLVGYSPWGRKELDKTERLHLLTYSLTYLLTYSRRKVKWEGR